MKKLLFAAVAAAMATPAMAATDGSLSTTDSTGTLDVTVNIPEMVRISGLDDLTINITPASLTSPFFNDSTESSSFCVYSNDGPDGEYSLTVNASASGVSGTPYALTGPETLPYSIFAGDEQSGTASFVYQFPGKVNTFSANADGLGRPTTLNCSNRGDNAIIRARVNNSDAIAVQAGTYTDTVTVTVAVI